MILEGPTARQLQLLRFIALMTLTAGFPPTIREIGMGLGINSTNAVADHLRALARKGFLEPRPPNVARGLTLTRNGWDLVAGPESLCPTCHQPIRRAA